MRAADACSSLNLARKVGPRPYRRSLTYINSNADVWVGWTAWNLDPYAISVTDKVTGLVRDTPKMAWYAPYF